jgi:hypothetical protein
MIQGFNRKWKDLFRRREGHRRRNEDILTAAVFGTLAYAEGHLRETLLRALCGKVLSVGHLRLWPRACAEPDASVVEPDALIDFSSPGQPQCLIIEVKWENGFRQYQALEQWRRSPLAPGATRQLLLVRSASEAEAHLRECYTVATASERAAWNEPGILTWGRLLEELRSAKGRPDAPQTVRGFVDDLSGMLETLGLRRFRGFDEISFSA